MSESVRLDSLKVGEHFRYFPSDPVVWAVTGLTGVLTVAPLDDQREHYQSEGGRMVYPLNREGGGA